MKRIHDDMLLLLRGQAAILGFLRNEHEGRPLSLKQFVKGRELSKEIEDRIAELAAQIEKDKKR